MKEIRNSSSLEADSRSCASPTSPFRTITSTEPSENERLSASSEDESLTSFNPGYLLDGVSAIDSENVVFKLNEPLKPGLIVPEENGEEPDFLYLIMPMRDPSRG